LDLSFDPAMQYRDTGGNGNHGEASANEQLKRRTGRIRDQPPEQADVVTTITPSQMRSWRLIHPVLPIVQGTAAHPLVR
jgi:hypothetical protein